MKKSKGILKTTMGILLLGFFSTSLAGNITFNIKDNGGSPLTESVKVYYNDYGNHYALLGTTTTGSLLITTLPDGSYKFKAILNYSEQVITNSVPGTVKFQTSKYIAHVLMHDASDFSGIRTQYNDYGNHWIDLSPQYTGTDGKASIELFPGSFNFKASKDYSSQTETLSIASEGANDIVTFQTALAVGFVKDCDNDNPVQGINVQYNDYGNHWINLSPSPTGVDGKATIELFPGTFALKANTIYTSQTLSIVLARTTTSVEFNPTRVCVDYSATVKYNDYGSHWINLPCNTYMFPGTYNFKINDSAPITVEISGCYQYGTNHCSDPSFVNCPSNLSSPASIGKCNANIDYNATVSDGDLSYVFSGTTTGSGTGTGSRSTFNTGVTTVTLTVTNSCGTATCGFTVTITDNEAPNAVCQDVSATLSGGAAGISTTDIDNGSSDACGIASLSLDNTDFSCADIGDNTVILTATDINSNVSTCEATVTVIGIVPTVSISQSEKPEFCQGGLISLTANPTGGLYFTYNWSNSQSSQSIEVNSSGSCVVQVTNNYGCSANDTQIISYTNHLLLSNYTIIARDEVKLDDKSEVKSGGVGVFGSKGKIEVDDKSKITASGTFAKAKTIKVSGGSQVTMKYFEPLTLNLPGFQYNNYCNNSCNSTHHNNCHSNCSTDHNNQNDHHHCKSSCKEKHNHCKTNCHREDDDDDDDHHHCKSNCNSHKHCNASCHSRYHKNCNSACNNSNHVHCNKNCSKKDHHHCSESNCNAAKDISVGSHKTVTLTDSIFGKVSVGKNATVTFTQPVIYMKELKTSDDVTIKFTSNCVVIKICAKMELKQDNSFNPTEKSVMIFVEEDFKAKEGSLINASVYSLEKISVEGDDCDPTTLTGMFIADEVKSDGAIWQWNTTCGACQSELHKQGPAPIVSELGGLIDPDQISLTVYPNPNRGQFGVDIITSEEGSLNVSVYDLTGRLVFTTGELLLSGPTYIPINLEHTAKSQYFVRASINGKIFIKPVFVNPTEGF